MRLRIVPRTHTVLWKLCTPGPEVKCTFSFGQRSDHHASLHARSPNVLSKTLILSVSYSETFCAFLFLLRLKRKQNKNGTTPLHSPGGPLAPSSPCLPLASCHWVLPSSPQVFEGATPSVWNALSLPFTSAYSRLSLKILFKPDFLPETSNS